MARTLEELGRDIGQFRGVTADSRLVRAGFIFVAVRGETVDGHDFIKNAVENGASVVVGEADLANIYSNYVQVPDSKSALGELASGFYGNPSQKLRLIGVTGTKGKTTTVYIIHHILTKLGKKAGLLSSISVPGLHVTSPDVVSLHKSLKEFVDRGWEYAVIEVSSHGITQKRIGGVKFEVGVLTNIAPEHLDYHGTMAEYQKTKMSFIDSCGKKVVWPKQTEINLLPGKYNNLDAECAVCAVEKLGISRKEAIEALKSFVLPEGRLTEIKNDLGIKIIIDFAHTPDSLEAVLTHLRGETKGKLISVFGCAGERDPGKRFPMGELSVGIADISIFTAEDPRSEDLFKIMEKMAEGAGKAGGKEGETFFRIPERGEAIAFALGKAQAGDTVAILGKGHEKSMAYGGYEHPWDDAQTVGTLLNKDGSVSAIILAAGKGTRMKSDLPKVLHKICGRPMIAYSLENLRTARIGEIITVVSFRKDIVIKEIGGAVKIAVQKNPKGGTADAINAGVSLISEKVGTIVVMYGDDTAFYSSETINKVIDLHRKTGAKLTFVTLLKDDPHGLGRTIRDKDGGLMAVVEEKDATEKERKVKEVNDGMYVFEKELLVKNLPKVKKNPITGELYVNEIIKMAIDQKEKISIYRLPDTLEWQGVNTPEEFEEAKKKMAARLK
jgi:UDP-N-acetylmuramoyl-L-alanyl-D-glutamate--2,6-diaminopimelate ligase